ncbi:MAG: threonine synthase [Ignavibacteriales bacterium]|nr:threonine synthase [Ignavibacteriales bacterium]
MKFYSTNNKNNLTDFRTAVMQGLADDGGLYNPIFIPSIDKNLFVNINDFSFQEISYLIASKFIEEEISPDKLFEIILDAINFPAPLIQLDDRNYVLELFHGPTLAFKDFGARFMARVMEHFAKDLDKELNILVATSGDTGSAVADGFYEKEGIKVFILYPSGMVSELQEKQLTTYGKNITALEISGTFDDCQSLVKQALFDKDIRSKLNLSSANSINISRLIPQIFYYFEAYKQLEKKSENIFVSVPSGNLGNLTAGLIAKKMGLPITKFIGGTNSNDVFTKFIETGKLEIKKTIKTYANAMDVSNPSNLTRIVDIYSNDINSIREDIFSESFSDDDIVMGIKDVYKKNNYIIDPHGSVGYLALQKYISEIDQDVYQGVVVETAHHAKFSDIVKKANIDIQHIPTRLIEVSKKSKQSIPMSKEFEEFKNYMLCF